MNQGNYEEKKKKIKHGFLLKQETLAFFSAGAKRKSEATVVRFTLLYYPRVARVTLTNYKNSGKL
jgi:hypothetical protein